MASKIEILIRNERESVIELSGVTDVNGHPVSLAPKGMEHDSRRCYDSVVTHQHVQTFLDQTPPWISVMKLNSDGTVPEEVAPVEAATFDTSDVPQAPRHPDDGPMSVELMLSYIKRLADAYTARHQDCAETTIHQTMSFDPVTHQALGGALEIRITWKTEPTPVVTEDVALVEAPAATEEVSVEPTPEDPIAVEPTPELLPVDDDALGPLPDLEEPTEVSTPKRRKSRNS